MPIVLRPLAERSSLSTRLLDLGRSRKTARVLAGAFGLLAAVLAIITLGCALDSAYHLWPVARAGFLLLAVGIGGVIFRRAVWRPLCEPVKAQAVAHLLEAKYPKLNDSLASAVDFLSSDNPATSARFRRIAVVRAQRGLEKCNTAELVPSGRAWKLAALAAVVIATAGGLGGWKPVHAGHSLVRLADPFGVHPWPTKTDIRVTTPAELHTRAALEEPFDIAFTLRGVIPDHATVAVQLDTGVRYEEQVPVEVEAGRTKADLSVTLDPHRIPRSFRFQVRANDAVSPWYAVTLAKAPKLVPLDGKPSPQLHVTYPAYTDLPAADLPPGSGVVQAVHGTRVRLLAATDTPVVHAVLVPQADRSALRVAASLAPLAGLNPFAVAAGPQLADSSYADIPVAISSDGTRLSAEFTPTLAGSYHLRFTDATGLTGSRQMDFQINPDPAPLVHLERPLPGKDPLILLPTAGTTVRATAGDRIYALRGMMIEYRVGGPDAPLRTLPLVDLKGLGLPLSAAAGGAVGFTHGKQVNAEATATLPVSAFRKADGSPPADGDRITLRAAATDYDDVSVRKDPGRSAEEVTILVVSRAALDTTLQQELAKLRPQLLRLREQQRQVRERTEGVQKEAAENVVKPDAGTRLDKAERVQQGVRTEVKGSGLTDARDGLQQAADLLQDTIRANGVPRSTTTDRVEAVAGDLKRLAEQSLDPAEPLLATAKQEADAAKPDAKKIADATRKAVGRQKAAEAGFDELLKLLEQWGGAGEVKAEARALKELLGKAGDGGKQAAEKVEPGKPAEQLSPQEKTELGKAAEPFDTLADRAAATIAKAEALAGAKDARAAELNKQADAKTAEAKAAGDAATAEKLNAAAEELRADAGKAQAEADSLRAAVKNSGNQDLINDLRAAGERLGKNNPDGSAEAQRSAAKRLDGIADALTEKPPDAADELKKKQQTADDAFDLEQQQDELRKKVEAAEKIEDAQKREEELMRLAREQEQLQKKAEDLLERLTRQREDAAADALRESVEKMQAAKDKLEQGKAPKDEQKQALDKLQESVDKLDREKEKDEQKLNAEKKTELAERLKAIRDRLQAADDEAARIQAEVVAKKGWDRAKETALRDLSGTAKGVADDLRKFTTDELADLPVYKQLAEQAATLTDAAAKRFAERLNDVKDAEGDPFDPVAEAAADDRTRRPLKTALRRLGHILDSLGEDKKPPTGAGQPMPMEPMPGGGEGMPPGGPMGEQPNGVPPLAQLKALRGIQAELNDRTRDFHKAHPDKAKHTPADQEELEEMERSQREVAELFDKLKGEFEKLKPQEPKLP